MPVSLGKGDFSPIREERARELLRFCRMCGSRGRIYLGSDSYAGEWLSWPAQIAATAIRDLMVSGALSRAATGPDHPMANKYTYVIAPPFEILPYNPSSPCPHSDRAWIWAEAEENSAHVCFGCHEITAMRWDPRSPEPPADDCEHKFVDVSECEEECVRCGATRARDARHH